MNAEAVAEDNMILQMVDGSRLHGTETEGKSDDDRMGVFVELPEWIFGSGGIGTYSLRENRDGSRATADEVDGVMYSLRRYTDLAANGNPSVLTNLFAPDDMVLVSSYAGEILRANRDLFVSEVAGHKFKGYMHNQLERLRGNSTSHLPKRPELQAEFGYDTKYAYHVARLAMQGVQFMNEGTLTLPLPADEHDLCMEIRTGHYTYDEVIEIIEYFDEILVAAVESTDLPEQPDREAITKLVVQLHKLHWEW